MCQQLLSYSQRIWSCVHQPSKSHSPGLPVQSAEQNVLAVRGPFYKSQLRFHLKGWRCFFALGSSISSCFFSTCHLRCAKRTYSAQKVTSWALLHWVSVSLRSRPPFPITCIDANRQNKTMWQAQKQTQGDSKASETWVCHTHIKPYSYIWWFPKKGVPPQIIHFSRIFQLTDRFSLHTFARRLCQRSLHHLHRWCKSWKVKTLRTGNFQGNISDSSKWIQMDVYLDLNRLVSSVLLCLWVRTFDRSCLIHGHRVFSSLTQLMQPNGFWQSAPRTKSDAIRTHLYVGVTLQEIFSEQIMLRHASALASRLMLQKAAVCPILRPKLHFMSLTTLLLRLLIISCKANCCSATLDPNWVRTSSTSS